MSAWAHHGANLFVEMRNEFASTDTLSRRSRGFPDTLSPRQRETIGHLAAAHLRRTLVVTYRSLPGRPIFIAELSDWDFSIRPPDSDFVFQPPPGVSQVELKPSTTTAIPK
jgi:hypothetical protein